MGELCGATIFSKFDLKFGYHQVCMKAGEDYKTSFKTHVGHFGYLMMSFGLTNAPTIVQALMNHIFHLYLHKLVIIFFDDILIYSPLSRVMFLIYNWYLKLFRTITYLSIGKSATLLLQESNTLAILSLRMSFN
uniref:Retrovirus-related Pol polyprotein from transposon 297 family n=1 Tax=Cajanus cajan TaxID=3821 RepID=A0A151SPQ1_CAJCA|nr:Retrovirus-related Pol polyprotein from transposon 297 family [Cajanus cajan]